MLRRDFLFTLSSIPFVKIGFDKPLTKKEKYNRAKYVLIDQTRQSGKTTFLINKLHKSTKGVFISSVKRLSNVSERVYKKLEQKNNNHYFFSAAETNKIRGIRIKNLFVDDFESVDIQSLEEVFFSFCSISGSPTNEDKTDRKIVIAGTNYHHNHFDRYIEAWKENEDNPDYLYIPRTEKLSDYV